jgi:hypothetical protein
MDGTIARIYRRKNGGFDFGKTEKKCQENPETSEKVDNR